MKTTFVIPTYNEAENLPKLAQTLFALPMEELCILVIDDASKDGTGEIAEGLKKEFPGRLDVIHRAGKLGLGSAYITGFKHLLAGDSAAIGQMDADFSHEPKKVLELVSNSENLRCCGRLTLCARGRARQELAFLEKMVIRFWQSLRTDDPLSAHPRHNRRFPVVAARNTGSNASGTRPL